MKKYFLFPLIALSLIFVSCSSDDDSSSNDGTNGTNPDVILPVKMKDGDYSVTEFQYDGEKMISASVTGNNFTEDYTFTYDGNKITKINIFEDYGNGDTGSTVFTYQYDGDKMSKLDLEDDGESFHYVVEWTTENGYEKAIISLLGEDNNNLNFYFDDNGNVIKEIDNFGDEQDKSDFNYDDKNAPFKNVKGMKEIIFANFFDFNMSKNNVTKETYTYIDGDEEPDTSVYDYNINYNDDNYPVEISGAADYTFTYNN